MSGGPNQISFPGRNIVINDNKNGNMSGNKEDNKNDNINENINENKSENVRLSPLRKIKVTKYV